VAATHLENHANVRVMIKRKVGHGAREPSIETAAARISAKDAELGFVSMV
jgi:hypothetical protein